MKEAVLSGILLIIFSLSGLSQVKYTLLQVTHADMIPHGENSTHLFGIIELPFLLISIFFAFATAFKMKGGRYGKGIRLLAWAFLVMAIGHLHMQIENFSGVNLLSSVLGMKAGEITWFLALVLSWGLSGLGFYYIFKAGRPD